MIRNLSPGGVRPSTLPLGRGGSPQYRIFMSERGLEGQSGVRTYDLWLSKQAALATAPGPPPNNKGIFIIFGLCPNILSFQRDFKLLFLGRFCKTLFLPEFFSDQLELTQHSQSSQDGCYDFSKSSSMFFRIYPWFHGSLYSWMAKGNFCLLVKWADTALCCSSNAKRSICLLVNWADTAFWLARQ